MLRCASLLVCVFLLLSMHACGPRTVRVDRLADESPRTTDSRSIVVQVVVPPQVGYGSALGAQRAGLGTEFLQSIRDTYPNIVSMYELNLRHAEEDERLRIAVGRLIASELVLAIREAVPNAVVIALPAQYDEFLRDQRDWRLEVLSLERPFGMHNRRTGPWGSPDVFADAVITVWPQLQDAGMRSIAAQKNQLMAVHFQVRGSDEPFEHVSGWTAHDFRRVREANRSIEELYSQVPSEHELLSAKGEGLVFPGETYRRSWYEPTMTNEEDARFYHWKAHRGNQFRDIQRRVLKPNYRWEEPAFARNDLSTWGKSEGGISPYSGGYRWLAARMTEYLDAPTLAKIRSRQLEQFCMQYSIDPSLALAGDQFRTDTVEGRLATKVRSAELRFLTKVTDVMFVEPMQGAYGDALRVVLADQEAAYSKAKSARSQAEFLGAMRSIAVGLSVAAGQQAGSGSADAATTLARSVSGMQLVLSESNRFAAEMAQFELGNREAQQQVVAEVSRMIGGVEVDIDDASKQIVAGDLPEFRRQLRQLVAQALQAK